MFIDPLDSSPGYPDTQLDLANFQMAFFAPHIHPDEIELILPPSSPTQFIAHLPIGKDWEATAFTSYLSLVGSDDMLVPDIVPAGPSKIEVI